MVGSPTPTHVSRAEKLSIIVCLFRGLVGRRLARTRASIMTGRVFQLIQKLYQVRGAGPSTQHFVRAHLVLSGINPDDHTATSPDDARKVAVLEKMLADFESSTSGGSRSEKGG